LIYLGFCLVLLFKFVELTSVDLVPAHDTLALKTRTNLWQPHCRVCGFCRRVDRSVRFRRYLNLVISGTNVYRSSGIYRLKVDVQAKTCVEVCLKDRKSLMTGSSYQQKGRLLHTDVLFKISPQLPEFALAGKSSCKLYCYSGPTAS